MEQGMGTRYVVNSITKPLGGPPIVGVKRQKVHTKGGSGKEEVRFNECRHPMSPKQKARGRRSKTNYLGRKRWKPPWGGGKSFTRCWRSHKITSSYESEHMRQGV